MAAKEAILAEGPSKAEELFTKVFRRMNTGAAVIASFREISIEEIQIWGTIWGTAERSVPLSYCGSKARL